MGWYEYWAPVAIRPSRFDRDLEAWIPNSTCPNLPSYYNRGSLHTSHISHLLQYMATSPRTQTLVILYRPRTDHNIIGYATIMYIHGL